MCTGRNNREIQVQINGRTVIVDPDFNPKFLNDYRWHISTSGYAVTAITIAPNKQYGLFMHHMVLAPGPGEMVDHINGNKLDNRRCNLRIATRSQNGLNRRRHKFKQYATGIHRSENGYRTDIAVANKRLNNRHRTYAEAWHAAKSFYESIGEGFLPMDYQKKNNPETPQLPLFERDKHGFSAKAADERSGEAMELPGEAARGLGVDPGQREHGQTRGELCVGQNSAG